MNPLVEKYGSEKIWLNWRFEEREASDGTLKRTKVPYRLNGRYGSSTDSTSWVTHSEALKAANRFDGVGIVFEPGRRLVGVDFDHCIDEDSKIPTPLKTFLKHAETYVERSPSKTGLHAFFHVSEPFTLENNRRPGKGFEQFPDTEVYTWGRYFTFTGDIYGVKYSVRTVSAEELFSLLAHVGYPWRNELHDTEKQSTKEKGSILTDEEVLEKMFSAKNGNTTKALYDGDLSIYNGDHSRCDLALCNALAFWTRKDPEQMRRIWTSSPLGNREKTQKRKDYPERTIHRAIESCMNVYTPGLGENAEEYVVSSSGKYAKVLLVVENVCRYIKNNEDAFPQLRFNDFSSMVEVRERDSDTWEHLQDWHILSIQRQIQSEGDKPFNQVSEAMVTAAVKALSYENKVNPPKEFVTSLQWDGTPRIYSWLHHVYGVPDDEVNQAIGSNWLKGLVKRIMRPGCQFDEVLVLEGPQGYRKSTSLRILGEPWSVETSQSVEDKDFYMTLAQNVVVEFAEGETLSRSAIKNMKSVITKTEDQIRLPYARGISTLLRGCVFAMSTNDDEYLKDETGNRRWLPVRVEQVADIEWLQENRKQLLAEAYHRVMEIGETTHEYPYELKDRQLDRVESSDYTADIIAWYRSLSEERRQNGIKLQEVYREVFHPGEEVNRDMNNFIQREIIRTLRTALALERQHKREGKRWVPTGETRRLLWRGQEEDTTKNF